jgi:DNA repair exonuclease SbcCD ATPase subunit
MTVTRAIRQLHPVLFLCLALTVATSALAAEDKKVAKAQQERIQRMQQAQQALEQEKSQLSAERTDMERKLGTVKTELDRALSTTRRGAAELKELKKVRADKDVLAGRLAELERQLAEFRQKLQASADADVLERKTLLATKHELDQRSKMLVSCETQNQGLYKLNTDLLFRYEKAFNSPGLLNSGPFTQLDRVRMENEGTTFRDQLEELKVQVPAKTQH